MPDRKNELDFLLADVLADGALNLYERERRARILRDIVARIQQDGEHVAHPHPDRAHQFMPFAALKGYHELARERERVSEPRQAMTEDRAAKLSQIISHLSKGSVVSIMHHEDDRYTSTCGMVTEIDETFRTIRIVKKNIDFDDIVSIDTVN